VENIERLGSSLRKPGRTEECAVGLVLIVYSIHALVIGGSLGS